MPNDAARNSTTLATACGTACTGDAGVVDTASAAAATTFDLMADVVVATAVFAFTAADVVEAGVTPPPADTLVDGLETVAEARTNRLASFVADEPFDGLFVFVDIAGLCDPPELDTDVVGAGEVLSCGSEDDGSSTAGLSVADLVSAAADPDSEPVEADELVVSSADGSAHATPLLALIAAPRAIATAPVPNHLYGAEW
jgi:hypothetical protein